MRNLPLRTGPVNLPEGIHLGTLTITFRGDSSLRIVDPAGHTFYQGGIPGARANDTATVTLDLSPIDTALPGDWVMTVTGNVQGTLTTT